MNKLSEIERKKIELEISEQLMISIAEDLPFIIKGSFLTKEYHKNPYARIENGGDIDLILNRKLDLIHPITSDNYYDIFMPQIDKNLQHEVTSILYKLEKILDNKFDLIEQPWFITALETEGYNNLLQDGEVELCLVNYASDGDFLTIGLAIDYPINIVDNQPTMGTVVIDIAINLPINFTPEEILYKTLDGREVKLKNTTPLLYQTAWKMHQTLCGPRIKDLDDLAVFLPHINFEDEETFKKFFDEIIKECKLTPEENANMLINNLIDLLSMDTSEYMKNKINAFEIDRYYYKLYNAYFQETLIADVCKNFHEWLHLCIDCGKALQYIKGWD
ncbi:MAG: hypothetical protein ATN35_05280 [Epulopiscium sp. Nele67-Bin004]|nr:MAG: hypothetical protein ATN35_05280 [Epulopiscium sp. Nele67-Bin004]